MNKIFLLLFLILNLSVYSRADVFVSFAGDSVQGIDKYSEFRYGYKIYNESLLSSTSGKPTVLGGRFAYSNTSPSLIKFYNTYYIAFQNWSDGKLALGYGASMGYWNGFIQINQSETAAKPDLAVFKDQLYVSFIGKDSKDIFISRTMDGSNWTKEKKIGGGSSATPSLVVYRNKLYVFYKGKHSNNLYYKYSEDGLNWSAETKISSFASSKAPHATEHNGKIYMTFKGSSSESIYVASSNDGKTWSSASKITNELTDKGPAIASNGDVIYLAFKGRSTGKIWYKTSSDGINWSITKPSGNKKTSGSIDLIYFD